MVVVGCRPTLNSTWWPFLNFNALIPQGPANKYISLRDRRSRRGDTIFGAKFSIRFFRYYIKFLNKENMHTYSYGVLLYSDGRMPPLVALFADLYQFCTNYVLSTPESARRMCWLGGCYRAIINRVLWLVQINSREIWSSNKYVRLFGPIRGRDLL